MSPPNQRRNQISSSAPAFPDCRSTEVAQIVAQRSPLVSVISDKREHDKEASGGHIPLDTVDLPFTGRLLTQVVLIGEELDDRRPAHAVLGAELPFTKPFAVEIRNDARAVEVELNHLEMVADI